jgi:hypothetical protein
VSHLALLIRLLRQPQLSTLLLLLLFMFTAADYIFGLNDSIFPFFSMCILKALLGCMTESSTRSSGKRRGISSGRS